MKNGYKKLTFANRMKLVGLVRDCKLTFKDWAACAAHFSQVLGVQVTKGHLVGILDIAERKAVDLIQAASQHQLAHCRIVTAENKISTLADTVASIESKLEQLGVRADQLHPHIDNLIVVVNDLTRRVAALERADQLLPNPSLMKEPACTTHS